MSEEVNTSFEEVSKLCTESLEIRAKIKESDARTKELEKQKAAVEAKISQFMEAVGMKSLDMHGSKFTRVVKTSVQTPKTIEEKKAFFDWLKERGEDLELLSINSNTLNSQYKSWMEEAAQNDVDDFKVPGLGEPRITTIVSVTAKNNKSEED